MGVGTKLIALYAVKKGNRRVYLHVDQVDGAGAVLVGMNRNLPEQLSRRGVVSIDGRTRYVHLGSKLLSGGGAFKSLVTFVFVAQLLYLAPVPMLFITGLVYVGWGLVERWWPAKRKSTDQAGKAHGNDA